MSELPPSIQQWLSDIAIDSAQMLDTVQVKNRIKRAKKLKGKGICPPKLVRELPYFLVLPLTNIFNNITASSVHPEQWKVEHQLLIPKVEILENEDQLPLMISKKAFNRVQHSLVIQDLYDMHTPN